MAVQTYDRTNQDVGNVVALEHVNLAVPDQQLAALFYVTGLGFTRDPYMDFGPANLWVNVGSQQLHLPTRGAQVLRGTIGVLVPDLRELMSRLARLEEEHGDRLADTAYGCEPQDDGSVLLRCPWGNRVRVHATPSSDGPRLGLPYVCFDVAPGGAEGIAAFYRTVLGAPATVVEDAGAPCAEIRIGCAQRLRFAETTAPLAAYDGHHIAVYLTNFSAPYAALQQRGLITRESNEHEYRFQDIVDPGSGAVLATVEHEVRSLFHPMFGRELVNRDPRQSQARYQPGADRFIGVTHGGRG
jgi:catechol 2,3-dioxygenase-like lactoylglutathione lyase family enzyme